MRYELSVHSGAHPDGLGQERSRDAFLRMMAA